MKNCLTCHKPFKPRFKVGVYCSRFCWNTRPSKTIPKEETRRRHALWMKDKMKNDPEFRAKRLTKKKEYYSSD